MTNEPKDNPDKVGYKTARDMLVDCANNTYCLTEELAEEYCDVILAEGERREREKERPKDVYSEGLTVGMGLGRQQALKEVEGLIKDELQTMEAMILTPTGLAIKNINENLLKRIQSIDQLRKGGE